MRILRRGGALLLIGGYLFAVRVAVFAAAWSSFSGIRLSWALSQLPYFLASLTFEGASVFALAALARLGRPLRWVSRALLMVLLWANAAGTLGFFTLRTYVKGFQLSQTNVDEAVSIGRSLANPLLLIAFALLVAMALLFAREGSWELRRPRWSVSAVAAACLVCVVALFARPSRFPALAHSPITLLLDPTPSAKEMKVPQGTATAQDWAPVSRLAPQWQQLGPGERHFNVVLLVLESTRASSFWPSPDAPALPHVSALAPHAVTFTRAYAHEPLSLKAFEALVFGTYPNPDWELTVQPRTSESLPKRWQALGMRTALIEHSLPIDGRALHSWGFEHLVRNPDIERMDPTSSDRTLIRAFDEFLDGIGGQRFGTVIWTRETHYPYDPTAPGAKRAPTPEKAYRDAIARIDGVVADLIALLDRRHLTDDTVIAVVGDHGEAFAEHAESGYVHGAWLFEESAHVPLMLVNPRLFHGEHDERLVQQKDLSAALAWLAGDESPNLNTGRCLFFERPSETAYLANSWDMSAIRGAVIRGPFKYLFAQTAGSDVADERLYDLSKDPAERHDLWPARPEEGRALRERFFGWLREQRSIATARADPGPAPPSLAGRRPPRTRLRSGTSER